MPSTESLRTIVFSHANGFPAGTYRSLFDIWRAAGFTVHAIEKYGHDPRFPVTSNWPHLRDQLLHFIDHEVGGPAHLVGHSMGGYLSLLAASRRPDLARTVVLLDSPVVSGWKARALQISKATGLGERFSPAHVSRRRRQHWPSAQAAFDHFAAKAAFARWAPDVLRDYIASGMEADTEVGRASALGQRLSFTRDVETAIYGSVPHHLARLLRAHPLHCPAAYIGGTRSHEGKLAGLIATKRLTEGRVSMLDGSHLFAMERPAEAAAEVLRWIEALSLDRLPAAAASAESASTSASASAAPSRGAAADTPRL